MILLWDMAEVDLFKQFETMPIEGLASYAQGFNIYMKRAVGIMKHKIGIGKEGIIIGLLDLEPKDPNTLKVLVNGEIKYWRPGRTKFIRAENRQW